MQRQKSEKIEQGSQSRLPYLPPKANVKSDHLRFREPGYVSAAERFQRLGAKIKLLQTEDENLKKEQEELRNKCQKDLSEMRQQRPLLGRAVDTNFSWLMVDAYALFDEIGEVLQEAISPDDLKGEQRQESVMLERLQRALKLAQETIEMENRKMQASHRELSTMKSDLDKLDKMLSEEDQLELSGKDHKSSWEEIEGQKEQDNDGEKEHKSENGDAMGNGDTEDGRRKETEGESWDMELKKNPAITKRKLQWLQNKERKKDLQSEINDNEKKIKACQQSSQQAKTKIKELQLQIDKILTDMEARDGGKQAEKHEEEDRLNKECEQIEEWSKQKESGYKLRNFQRYLRHNQGKLRYRSCKRGIYSFLPNEHDSDESGLDDELLKVAGENDFKQVEKTLQDAGELGDMITNVRWLREKADRKRDLRLVLGWERYLEGKWLKQVGHQVTETQETNPSIEEKDYLTDNPLQHFKIYEPLGFSEVRLLLLMPSPKECADYPLICALETKKWDNDHMPEYAALSYHWGKDSDNGRLYLLRGGLPEKVDEADWGFTARRAIRIPIRNNLFRALLRLRRHDNPVALWVDYLCIDQVNKEEKTKQLNNMVNVYHNAKNVCIWLGEGDNRGRSDNAMSFIPTIMDFAVLDSYAKDTQQADNWNALGELMRDRWFSRRWVVQEISLARNAAVHCGGKTVHWSDFADAVSLLASNQETIKNLFDYSTFREGPNTLGDVQSFGAYILLEATSKLFLRDAKGGIRMPRTNIESLVTSLTTFDTGDRRDLIYSLVSIARDTSPNSGIYGGRLASQRGLAVDYRKTLMEVYMDFTKFCMKTSHSLDIICRPWAMPLNRKKDKPKDEDDDNTEIEEVIPSWIPLLSNSEYGTPDEVYSGRKNGVSLVGPAGQESRYAASLKKKLAEPKGHEAHQTSPGKDYTRSIFLRGFKLAKIKTISARNTGGVILRESLEMGCWTGIQNHDSVPDKIWRTLVADRDSDGQIPPTWYQRACMRCLEIADTFNNGDLNFGELLQGHSEMLRKYLTRVRNVTWNRTFFNATMTEETRDKDGLENYAGNSNVVLEEDVENSSDSPSGGVENSLEVDEVNDSKDVLKKSKIGKKDDAAEEKEVGGSKYGLKNETGENDASEKNVENKNGINDQEVRTINEGESLQEGSMTEKAEKLNVVEMQDEPEILDSEEVPENEMQSSDETSEDYNLFGLGPPRLKMDDFVCILYGCSVPVILREVSQPKGHYILIGEAYVHGKMDGEAIADHGRDKTWGKEQTFELR